MMKRRRNSIVTAFAVAAVASAGALAYVSLSGSKASASGRQPAIPALRAMAAMKNPTLAVTVLPDLVRRLPGDMSPAAGTVRELVRNLGTANFTVYAWPQGASDSICLVSTGGGGGCLGSFSDPFDVSISDADALGSGQPVLVWGPITDDVTDVAITVNGQVHHALIKNNIAFYELPDRSLAPSAVQAITVTLKDGNTQNIRV